MSSRSHPTLPSLFAALLVLALHWLAPAARADDPAFVPRQALVRLAPGASINDLTVEYGVQTLVSLGSRNIHLLQLPENPDEQTFVDLFAADPRVIYADLNFYAEDTDADGTTQDIFLARTFQQYLADPTFVIVRSPAAHAVSRGEGVTLAVIDSGIDWTHPVFAGRIAPGGYNFIENNTDVSDGGVGLFAGHGTAVSGIVLRVAPDSRVLPLRVMDSDGSTTTFRLSQAIFHAVDQGARVINISLGTLADPFMLRDAVSEAVSAGVVIVAAAGNDDAESPPRSPAGLSDLGVIAVTATDAQLVKAPFSNFGTWVSVAAPGVSVHGPFPGGGYAEATGTSFAAPLVSGAVALAFSACPNAAASDVRAAVLSAALPIDVENPSYIGMLGSGLLDCAATVALAAQLPNCHACPADFDGSGELTVADVFAFLGSWFSGDPRADANGDGLLNVSDVFAFLSAWFAGCA